MEARLRRDPPGSSPDADEYRFGDVRVDFRRAEVYLGDLPIDLSAREFQLLRYFVRHRGETVSQD